MTDAPERIWAFHEGPMVGLFVGKSPGIGRNVAEYVRADLSGWQDISTAPKDGTRIIAMRNERGRAAPSFIYWDYEDGWCGMTAEDEKRVALYKPTNWMPLPPPPKDE